ncbi:hypothetical protein QE152_g7341 [Popillia japonica]|uniref:Uncharacterized protein n=1 Tax=Popillia japonica TaxID=7064 RepID=A0AAW1MF19_POPJA
MTTTRFHTFLLVSVIASACNDKRHPYQHRTSITEEEWEKEEGMVARVSQFDAMSLPAARVLKTKLCKNLRQFRKL